MATITLKGNPIHTLGELPAVGQKAPDFVLVKNDLSRVSLKDFLGSKLVLNIFPSVDTSVCATSVRKFNQRVDALEHVKVLCISRDLPFAQARFCGAEGIKSAVMLSDYVNGEFGKNYHLEIIDGPFAGLHSRVVIVLDEEGRILYKEQVGEIGDEPDYSAAMTTLE